MVQKTLLVCFGPLGRLLNSFCAAARLREAAPDGHLVLLTSPSLVGLAAKSPWFDNIISADLSANDINLSHLAKAIKQNKFDRIIDLERSDATATMFTAFGLFPPKFAGHAPRAKWRLPPQIGHPIDADNQLLDLVGIALSDADLSLGPKLDWLLRQIGKTPSLEPAYFGLEGSYVLLNLGNLNPEQIWPAMAFQTLAGDILNSGHMLAITGGMDTRDLARPLIRKYPQIRDLCARADPFQLAALGVKAKGVVGMADGVLHLCAAGSARCISLHGSKASAKAQAIRTPNAVCLIAEPLEELSAADVLKAMKMFGAL